MKKYMSHGSAASIGASKGPGPVAGAGMHMPPGAGPGPAARRKVGMGGDMYPSRKTPSGKAPKGMSTYRQE